MASALLPSDLVFRAFTQSGTFGPLAGGWLYFYAAGTNTPQAAYSDHTGATALANPLQLDANGQANFWLKSGLTYKINLVDSALAQQTGWPVDNIAGDTTAAAIAALAGADGAGLIGYQNPVFGAAVRTLEAKASDILNAADFPSLTEAVTAIGSDPMTILVSSAVAIADDLTIPANIAIEVLGSGVITVPDGKRLTINGHFTAPRTMAFESTLHAVNCTAYVSGNHMYVTAVASGVISAGHVVLGIAGAPPGTLIGQIAAGTSGGVGDYYLNNPLDLVASQTVTMEGPSVIFGPGAVECALPEWFGAIAGDDEKDNSDAFKQAVYSMPWGGRLRVPAGKYMVMAPTVLHGGIVVEGDSQADAWQGSPPNSAAVPAFIWLGTGGIAAFIIGGGQSNVQIRNIAISSDTAPGNTPPGTGTKGIEISGHYPAFIWNGAIEHCSFYALDTNVIVNDTWAGNTTYRGNPAEYPSVTSSYSDWSVAPFSYRNNSSFYSGIGIQFNTNNADGWNLEDSTFFVAPDGAGVKILRCGYLKMDNCFGGGAAIDHNILLHIVADGDGSLDTIVLDNCQGETLTQFIKLDNTSTNTWVTEIIARNCIWQMGAEVYLGAMCAFISEKNQVIANVYRDAPGCTIDSTHDKFDSGYHILPLGNADDTSYIRTMIPGFSPDTNFPGITLAGRVTIYGTEAPATGTWNVGDRCINSAPASGHPVAWVCATAGTFGTLSGVTGSITSGTALLTVNSTTGLIPGGRITIAGVSGTKIIKNITDLVVTLDSNANATVSTAAVAYAVPVFGSEGNLP